MTHRPVQEARGPLGLASLGTGRGKVFKMHSVPLPTVDPTPL